MRFNKIIPADRLKPYIKYLAVSENKVENSYRIFPSTGLVIGFQYRGQLNTIKDNSEINLATCGITGIADSFKIFKNSADIGTILIYLSEAGLNYFTPQPAHELFNQSISLDHIFDRHKVKDTAEKLAFAETDAQRIFIIEQFLLSQLRDVQADKLITEAVKRIYDSRGMIRITALAEKLFISQSPLEKRFRKLVGITPKKFASIVRFHSVLHHLNTNKTLIDICYENNFFDQAHFIKDFKQYTGDTPENFNRLR